MLLIALICIAAYILVQFAFIDLFIWLKWEKPAAALEITTFPKYAFWVTYAAILAPIMEETIFRLGLFYLLLRFTKIKPIFAILISALVFAIYHHSFNQFIYQFILGVIFATAFYLTGNFFYPIMLHFINNFFIVTYTFIAQSDVLPYTWGVNTIFTLVFLATLGSLIIVALFQKIKEVTLASRKL